MEEPKDDESVGSLPPPPGTEDETEVAAKAQDTKAKVEEGEEEEPQRPTETSDEKEGVSEQDGNDEAAGSKLRFADAGQDDHNTDDVSESPSKAFLKGSPFKTSPFKGSPFKASPFKGFLDSPPGYAIGTAGSPPPFASPPPYAVGTVHLASPHQYAAPSGHYVPYPSPHDLHRRRYQYPYPPTRSHRMSPPSTAAGKHGEEIVPATPASAPGITKDSVGRRKAGAKKVSPKAAATPSTVGSSSTSGTPPASTPVTGKPQRGLRHFSVMVCKHVEQRGSTTYNQVADELVSHVLVERKKRGEKSKGKFDEKNIRRRVYDALNVLLAMGIIRKDKKDITWIGLPRSLDDTKDSDDEDEDQGKQVAGDDDDADKKPAASPPAPVPSAAVTKGEDEANLEGVDEPECSEEEIEALEQERLYLESEVARKQESLREMLVQQVCFRNLVMRNQHREYPTRGAPHVPPPQGEKIPLPFIICNTKPSAVVQCDMNREKNDVMFEFDSPFEINDDNTILKRMNMDKTTVHALHDMLPEDMFEYCRSTGLLETILLPGEDARAGRRQPYYQYDRAYRY